MTAVAEPHSGLSVPTVQSVSSRGAALQASVAKRCMPPKALSTVEVRRRPSAAQVQREAATDERVGLFTPDKDGDTHTSCGRAAVIAARRGTVCGEVGRVPEFLSTVTRSFPPYTERIFTITCEVCATSVLVLRDLRLLNEKAPTSNIPSPVSQGSTILSL